MSACRSCLAPITWVRTVHGEHMPLNPRPQPGGNVELHNGVAYVVQPEPAVLRYTSHFASCPAANGHRKEQRR